jgi:hypothetical protein
VSVIGAPPSWIGHMSRSTRAARGGVAAVRRRITPAERRLGRQVGLGAIEISAARQLERRLEQEQRELRIEAATLTSPRRLETVARTRLGMGPPAPGQIVNVP